MEEVLYRRHETMTDYFIGNNGFLFSTKQFKFIKWQVSNNGYVCAVLHKDKKPTRVYQHRMMAQAFIENPMGKKEVNHINFDKMDNRLSNLEWNTPSENSSHYTKSITPEKRDNKSNVKIKLSEHANILELRKNGLTHSQIASKYGVSRRLIGLICSSFPV